MRIEIDIGQGGKDGFIAEEIGGLVNNTELPPFLGIESQPLQGMD